VVDNVGVGVGVTEISFAQLSVSVKIIILANPCVGLLKIISMLFSSNIEISGIINSLFTNTLTLTLIEFLL
jgi:hypothetical protein